MTSFPTGRCSLGDACFVPHHELRKRCPGCDGLIHLLCGRCLWEDEGGYKENSVLCPWCDPKRKNSQAPLRPGVGLKSPRRMQPSNLAPPIVEKGDQHIELDGELSNKVDDELRRSWMQSRRNSLTLINSSRCIQMYSNASHQWNQAEERQ